MLQPLDDMAASNKSKHKFMIQSMFAPQDFSLERLDVVWKNTPRSQKMDSFLRCRFVEDTGDMDSFKSEGDNMLLTPTQEKLKPAEVIGQKLVEQSVEQLRELLREANHRAEESHQREAAADERAQLAEQRAAEIEERMRIAETADQVAWRRLSSEEQHEEFWVLQREEIRFTGRELGRGDWAVVTVARFRGLPVAAKQMHGVIISNYNRQLFIREMNIAAKIRHPNILHFIGATIKVEPIILTELMATSLRAILEQGPLSFPHIVSISTDVSRALNYLHLMKPDAIIHRGISSSNVLLDPAPNNSWKAKVSDYGSCNFVWHVTTAAPGNATYAAPEASNPAQQSTKMDVFSYGVLLLETCTQQFPNVDDREVLLLSIQWPELASLTTQCLKQEPANRPTMAEILEQLGRM